MNQENEEAKSIAVEELIQHWKRTRTYIDGLIGVLQHTSPYQMSVDKIMYVKQAIMLAQCDLPLTQRQCYFCNNNNINQDADCTRCQYAKIHGLCDKPGSTYRRIANAQTALVHELHNYYVETSHE